MRGIEERLTWYRRNRPSAPGMCAEHVWLALGGPKDPPRQGLPDATAVARAVPAGKMMKGRAPRGSIVYWDRGSNGHGHTCFALGDGTELSVDVDGPRTVGVKPFPWFAANWPTLRYLGWSWYWGKYDTQPREEEPTMKVSGHREYTGKISTPAEFPLDDSWHDLPGFAPFEGSPFTNPDETHSLYVRLLPEWGPPVEGQPVAPLFVELRYVRSNGDATAHDENQYAPGSASIPLRAFHDEYGQKNVGGRWQLKMHGGPLRVVLSTRYAKLRAFDTVWV